MEKNTKRPDKRRELGAKSRDDILNAALSIMSQFGYEGASVSKIASESGLPSSSIYWHFGSKSGVLAAVVERGAGAFFGDYAGSLDLEAAVVDPLSTLRQGFSFAQRSAEDHPEFLRLLFLLSLSGEHDPRVVEVLERAIAEGRAQLHALIKHAFSSTGVQMSTRIADELADFAQAIFDGAFLDAQTRPQVSHASLIGKMAESIYSLGLAIQRRDAQ